MGTDERLEPLIASLRSRRVIPDGVPVEVERLSGGVSADVFLLIAGSERLVAKRSLEKLRVVREWRSSPSRIFREADAMVFARRVRPDNVPEIVEVDDQELTLVMLAAPAAAVNWKTELLSGRADPAVAERLGHALADWHSRSSIDREAAHTFEDATNFYQLRIDPFFLRVAELHPDLATTIRRIVATMTMNAVCLVHGDFSPKNVLVEEERFWVLDWETAHWGDPTFDAAFLVSHLLCKAVHRPSDAPAYRACADRFLDAYRLHSLLQLDDREMVAQAGCLVLARVDGTSPVDYFSPRDQQVARALGRAVLLDRTLDFAGVWALR